MTFQTRLKRQTFSVALNHSSSCDGHATRMPFEQLLPWKNQGCGSRLGQQPGQALASKYGSIAENRRALVLLVPSPFILGLQRVAPGPCEVVSEFWFWSGCFQQDNGQPHTSAHPANLKFSKSALPKQSKSSAGPESCAHRQRQHDPEDGKHRHLFHENARNEQNGFAHGARDCGENGTAT